MKSTALFAMTLVLLAALPGFAQVTVMPVPWDPTNFTSPHTVVTGTTATLTATVSLGGSADSFTYSWNFGDGSAATAFLPVTTTGTGATVGNVYNLSVTHVYPVATGVFYTAVLTVKDTTNPASYTGNYYLVVQPSTLQASVNQAIDAGLWYLHTSMDRTTTVNANSQTIKIGGWDGQLGNGCLHGGYACLNSVGLDATNVQAFEVSGHYENASALDPYTDDVARGLARVISYLVPYANGQYDYGYGPGGAKVIGYNPALNATRCSDGSLPNNYGAPIGSGPGQQNCTSPLTLINYNPGATTCASPPCTFTYDGNTNGQILIPSGDGVGDWGYQTGMLVTAIVASQNTAGVARTGPGPVTGPPALPGVLGQTYLNIVQDLIDGIGYCQYYGNSGSSSGYDNGGGWEYYCAGTSEFYQYYDDNSPSQWNAIAMIAANRGFGIAVPQIVKDTNQVWITWDQCFSTTCTNDGFHPGMYGYDEWTNPVWGPWAVTPSGMVQLAMDGIGRTAAGNLDQRWNLTESYYRDNFCNATSGGSTVAPKAYTYGLFSFTKAMEQHDPGGALSPITLLEDQPAGTNPIDWYGAQASSGAPCDGVAQTLVSRQNYGGVPGVWYGQDYNSYQYYFETAWSTIMLQKTSFVACVSNLGGAGKASSRSSGAEVTLTWSGIADASAYQVQRSSTNGGPYSNVGSPTAALDFVDQTAGLVNGHTYYYVLQPLNSNQTAVCTSNQAAITIP
jgi:hypothetical protein